MLLTFINNIKTRQNTKAKFSLNKLWPEGSGLLLKTKQKYKYLRNVNRKQSILSCVPPHLFYCHFEALLLGNTLIEIKNSH